MTKKMKQALELILLLAVARSPMALGATATVTPSKDVVTHYKMVLYNPQDKKKYVFFSKMKDQPAKKTRAVVGYSTLYSDPKTLLPYVEKDTVLEGTHTATIDEVDPLGHGTGLVTFEGDDYFTSCNYKSELRYEDGTAIRQAIQCTPSHGFHVERSIFNTQGGLILTLSMEYTLISEREYLEGLKSTQAVLNPKPQRK